MLRFLWVLFLLWPLAGFADGTGLPSWRNPLVNDKAGILSDETEAQLRTMLQAQRDQFDHEVAVLTVNSRLDYERTSDIADFGTKVFNAWGIGNAERNDGVLLLVAVEDREMRIALGSGYSARYDGIAARIIDSIILPQFRAGRMERGVLHGTEAILERLNLVAPPGAQDEKWTYDPYMGLTRSEKVATFISDNKLLSALMAGVTAVLGFFGIRWGGRNRPRKCPECGRMMLRLGDTQEDQYLNHGQLVEEQLASKDYGVWFCEHDEHVTVVGYPTLFSSHSACPKCRFKTRETRKVVETHPTYDATGVAWLHYECANCDHQASRREILPMLVRNDDNGVSFGGGSFGGGGGGGGGFGGGSSSGGGSSGSW